MTPDSYVSYFFDGPHQGTSLAAALALAALLTLLAAPLFNRQRMPEAGLVFGWSIAATALTVLNILFGLSFEITAWLLGAGVLYGAWHAISTRTNPFPAGVLRVLLVLSPVLLMAAAMVPSQWDEFSHWVPTVRFLMEFQALPTRETSVTGGFFPGYPYNWSLLSYLSGLLAGGRFLDNVGALINLLLLTSFGIAAVRIARMGADAGELRKWTWMWAGLAVALATLMNPTFVQKVVITAYADTSTGVATGFGFIFGWLLLEALAKGEKDRARSLAWQFALVNMVMINVKQSNLVLFLLLLLGLLIVAWRDENIRLADLLRLLPILALGPIAVYALWRYHLITEDLVKSEAGFVPYELWPLDKLHLVLGRMLSIAGNKSGHFGLGFIAAAIGIAAFMRVGTPLKRVAMMAGVLFLGFNGFMFLMYIVQFGPSDALRAASLWRYNMQIGPAVFVFGLFGAGMLWKRFLSDRPWSRHLGWIPLIVVLAAPFGLPLQIRFDLEAPKPHFHHVGRELAKVIEDGTVFQIMDPEGSGESNHITRYYLWKRDVHLTGYLSAFQKIDLDMVAQRAKDVTHLLIHSVNGPVLEYLGLPLENGTTYFVERRDGGTWAVIAEWPYPPSR